LSQIVADKNYDGNVNDVSINIINENINQLIPECLHIYLSLNYFKYHRTYKRNRVYCSAFFFVDNKKSPFKLNSDSTIFNVSNHFYFKKLLILDIFDPKLSRNGYSELPSVENRSLIICKIDITEFFTVDFLEKISMYNDRNKDLSVILHFNRIG
jgi:hypothetical protein